MLGTLYEYHTTCMRQKYVVTRTKLRTFSWRRGTSRDVWSAKQKAISTPTPFLKKELLDDDLQKIAALSLQANISLQSR